MGMAYVTKRPAPEPLYAGTIVCHKCHAEYRPCQWVYGYYAPGTTNDWRMLGPIPDDECPLCGAKNPVTTGGTDDE